MKHIMKVTAMKAESHDADTLDAILSRVFSFVLDVIDAKGKTTTA